MKILGKAHRELLHEHEWLKKAKYRAERDGGVAFEMLEALPSVDTYAKEQEQFAAQKSKLSELMTKEHSLRQSLETSRDAALKATTAGAEWKAALASSSRELREMSARVGYTETRLAAVGKRLEASRSVVRATGEKLSDTQKALDATRNNIVALSSRADVAEEGLDQAETALERTEQLATELEASLLLESAKTAPKRGRPAGHRGAEWLTANWDSYNADARRVAFWRHCNDIRDGLHSAGIDDWLPSALARVLDGMQAGDGDDTWVDYLFSSRPFCKRKNDFVSDLRDIAQAEWGLDLSHHALEIVGLSRQQYQDLRNSFSKSIYRPPN